MKLTITIAFLINCTCLSGQSVFPTDSTVWQYEAQYYGLGEKYTALGDTIIESKTYSKIFLTYFISLQNQIETKYLGAYRTDNSVKRVYFFPKDSVKEHVLMDFNLKVGDTMPNSSKNHPIILEEVDTVYLYCKFRIRQRFNRTWFKGFNIDGIGSTSPSFHKIYNSRFEPTMDPKLVCFQEGVSTLENNFVCKNKQCLIDNLKSYNDVSDTFEVYPNPSNGIFEIKIHAGGVVRIYDNMGALIYEAYARDDELLKIDISSYPKGSYFLKTMSGFKNILITE